MITLDSDDEDTNAASPSVSNLLTNGNNGGITIKRIPAAPKVIPRNRPGAMANNRLLPLPAGMAASTARSPMMANAKKAGVPRKPGVFPPFALFSQEQRPMILSAQPNISFGEIGRKLGEMWHALSEGEKEEYRRRAREISDQKMVDYQQSLAKMPPQQRQMVNNQVQQKRRKTHGYAIFSAEMKKNLGNAMSPQETANVIAESWRAASPAVRRDYEERAARMNAVQERRIAQMTAQNQQQTVGANHNRFNNASNSGLRISSVSSLSPQTKRRPPMMGGPGPSSLAGPKLPSGITISRVEPEISIVDENVLAASQNYAPVPQPRPVQAPMNHMMPNRGRGMAAIRRPVMSPAAQAAMRVKAQLRASGGLTAAQQWANSQRGGAMMNRRGGRMPINGNNMLKRPLVPNLLGVGPKKMRPAMPNMLEQKLCRSCGFINPVGCRLAERTDILEALSELTMTHIDLVKDQNEGYPGEICRRCLTSITNFTVFKKTFNEGQTKLKNQFAPPTTSTTTTTTTEMLPLPDSIAASPMESFAMVDLPKTSDQEESILPDLDCEVDYGENPANIPQPVDIKEERVRLITPTSLGKITIKEEVSKPMISENIVEGGKQEKVAEVKREDPLDKAPVKEEEDKETKMENGENQSTKDKVDDPLNFNSTDSEEEKKEESNGHPKNSDDPLQSVTDSAKSDDDPLDEDAIDRQPTKSAQDEPNPIEEESNPIEKESNPLDEESNPIEEETTNPITEEENSKSNDDPLNFTENSNSKVDFDDPLNCNDDEEMLEEPLADTEASQSSYTNGMESNSNNINELEESMDNMEESSNGVVPDMDSTQQQPQTNESFVNCSTEDEQTRATNASNEDPFESFAASEEAPQQMDTGSQDANDAFEPPTDPDDTIAAPSN